MWPQISQPITILRRAAQTIVDYEPVPGEVTEIPGRASWQPAGDPLTPTDPGYSAPKHRVFALFTEVRTASESDQTPADLIELPDDSLWLVMEVSPCPALGLIPRHWEAKATRWQGNRPPIPVVPDP